jgi:hypothetical protein
MRCPVCGSTAVTERPERTTQGYRRFRCGCGKQFNERSAGWLNRTQYPSDVIALVVLWRLRYKLTPGMAYVYDEGDLHAPTREGPTKLLRNEGTNMDRVSRLSYEAV